MRESHVVLLHPPAAQDEDAWVTHTEFDVQYSWNITRVMFSRGNVNERRRARGDVFHGEKIAQFLDCLA